MRSSDKATRTSAIDSRVMRTTRAVGAGPDGSQLCCVSRTDDGQPKLEGV
jgi:hypothetical protein